MAKSIRKLYFLAGMMLLIMSNASNPTMSQEFPSSLNFQPSMNFVITLINYDEALVDTSYLDLALPSGKTMFQDYNFNYDIQFANNSYESLINDHIDSLAVEDWTSALNITALQEQVDVFERKAIFSRQNGTAVPVQSLETFLADNKPTTSLPDENLFHIFVFNLSRLDNGDEHWFNHTEIDLDSGQRRDYWRLEWDYPTNYGVKFPYAAYSQAEDVALIDPTAFQWYLTWREIWNSNVDSHPTYSRTLTEYIQGQPVPIAEDRVTDTILEWSSDWIYNIFSMYTFPLPFGTPLEVQLASFYNSSQKSQDDLEWIINEQEIIDETNVILRSPNFEVNVYWYDVATNQQAASYISQKELDYETLQERPSPFEDWTFYDGNAIWTDTYENQDFQQQYFTSSNTDLLVKGTILLLENASYAGPPQWIPWSGGLYTGLGGSQVITMLWEMGRAFYPDGSHKAGLSKVMIHEIGHSIGLPHTFTSRFTSDFANDVMGYYPGTSDYSKLVSLAYDRNALDNIMFQIQDRYVDLRISDPNTQGDLLSQTNTKFLEIINHHASKNYYEGYLLAVDALGLLEAALDLSQTTETSQSTSSTTVDEDSVDSSDDVGFLSTSNYIFTISLVVLTMITYQRRYKLK